MSGSCLFGGCLGDGGLAESLIEAAMRRRGGAWGAWTAVRVRVRVRRAGAATHGGCPWRTGFGALGLWGGGWRYKWRWRWPRRRRSGAELRRRRRRRRWWWPDGTGAAGKLGDVCWRLGFSDQKSILALAWKSGVCSAHASPAGPRHARPASRRPPRCSVLLPQRKQTPQIVTACVSACLRVCTPIPPTPPRPSTLPRPLSTMATDIAALAQLLEASLDPSKSRQGQCLCPAAQVCCAASFPPPCIPPPARPAISC